jgi:hypothetical protein
MAFQEPMEVPPENQADYSLIVLKMAGCPGYYLSE